MGDTCGDNRFELFGISEQLDCSDCVNHGGDWDCDYVHCHKDADTISRAAVIDVIENIDCSDGIGISALKCDAVGDAVNAIKALPPACHLLEDGTLIVTVPNLSEVRRVIVDEEDSQYCKAFYQDGDGDG